MPLLAITAVAPRLPDKSPARVAFAEWIHTEQAGGADWQDGCRVSAQRGGDRIVRPDAGRPGRRDRLRRALARRQPAARLGGPGRRRSRDRSFARTALARGGVGVRRVSPRRVRPGGTFAAVFLG